MTIDRMPPTDGHSRSNPHHEQTGVAPRVDSLRLPLGTVTLSQLILENLALPSATDANLRLGDPEEHDLIFETHWPPVVFPARTGRGGMMRDPYSFTPGAPLSEETAQRFREELASARHKPSVFISVLGIELATEETPTTPTDQ